jgi:hypothetical protein
MLVFKLKILEYVLKALFGSAKAGKQALMV